MKILQGNRLPKPNGHYSTAIVSNHFLFISGQLPISSDGTHHEDDDFEGQFNVVFQNIENILVASSSSLQKIVKVTASGRSSMLCLPITLGNINRQEL
jgi:enamine deaminase RidA (YjgF/YER057c/UK114 family)